MNRTVTKIIAIILALVIAGGVCVAAVQAFAMGPAPVTMTIPATGEGNTRSIVIVVAAVAAVGIVASVLAPKFKK